MQSVEGRATKPNAGFAGPGTLPWLLGAQLRVTWRSLTLNRGIRIFLVIAAVVLVASAAAAAPRLWSLRGPLSSLSHLSGFGLLALGAASLVVFLLMFSSAISATLEALYERGDLDLLLGAPIRPRLVLASRLLGVAVSAGLLYALLSVPVLVFALAAGLWRLFGLVPWLASLSLFAASTAGLLTLGLVRLIGVRRARTAASVVGAISGAAFFLLSQYRNLVGQSSAPVIGQDQIAGLSAVLKGNGPLGGGSPLWYPARALWLEPLPTLVTLLFSAGLFWLSVRLLENAFQSGAQQAGMRGSPARSRAVSAGPLRFREGPLALMVKEWRLLSRDPLLLSRILLQVVYLLPITFLLLRNGAVGASALVGGGGVLVLGSLAGSLASITTNAEDAPELLMAAPQRLSRLRWLKLWAAVLPVLAVWLLLALLSVFGGAQFRPGTLLGSALSLWSILGSALIVLWRPMELRRADLFRRGQRSDLLVALSTLLMQAGLLAALYFLPRGSGFGALGLAFALVGPLLALRGKQPRD